MYKNEAMINTHTRITVRLLFLFARTSRNSDGVILADATHSILSTANV